MLLHIIRYCAQVMPCWLGSYAGPRWLVMGLGGHQWVLRPMGLGGCHANPRYGSRPPRHSSSPACPPWKLGPFEIRIQKDEKLLLGAVEELQADSEWGSPTCIYMICASLAPLCRMEVHLCLWSFRNALVSGFQNRIELPTVADTFLEHSPPP